jgi:hypothetical protein
MGTPERLAEASNSPMEGTLAPKLKRTLWAVRLELGR